ncbi:MAG: hypothetical protein GY720_22320 [bacterium]|nr:hypothetical protein [bacterium]
MVALAGPFFIFAFLLVVTGVPKLTRPDATARAISAIGLPAHRNLGRAVGVAEVVIGIAALLIGGSLAAAAVALMYGGFAGFILIAMRSEKAKSCGCFGDEVSPPNYIHFGLDIAAAAVAGVLVFQPIEDLVTVMGESPWAGLPLVLLVLTGTWMAMLVLTLLPGRRT